MMGDLAKDLDIPFKRNGAMVVCIHESEKDGLKDLYNRGIANGVKELKILNREECLEIEPNLSDKVVAALYAPTSGIICPFMLNIAMAENANVNGVELRSSHPTHARSAASRSGRSGPTTASTRPATSSTQQASMQTISTIWSLRRRSISHPDAVTIACLTRL